MQSEATPSDTSSQNTASLAMRWCTRALLVLMELTPPFQCKMKVSMQAVRKLRNEVHGTIQSKFLILRFKVQIKIGNKENDQTLSENRFCMFWYDTKEAGNCPFLKSCFVCFRRFIAFQEGYFWGETTFMWLRRLSFQATSTKLCGYSSSSQSSSAKVRKGSLWPSDKRIGVDAISRVVELASHVQGIEIKFMQVN